MKKISLLIISVICFITTYSQSDFKADTTIGAAPCVITFEEYSTTGIKWTWDFGDGECDHGFHNPIAHPYTQAGIYTVTLIVTKLDYSNDTVIKTDYITILLKDNILEQQLELLRYYPNPVQDVVYFNQEIDNYSVYDNIGNKVLFSDSKTSSIDISILSGGVYYIVLNRRKIIKIVKNGNN